MMRENFARFLNKNSGMDRVRAARETGFDAALWRGLADLGAFAIRVPEEKDGLGLGLIVATTLMEEAGRTLVSGPLAECLVAARVLAASEHAAAAAMLAAVLAGDAVVTVALRDVDREPTQWVAGGAVARAIVARRDEEIELYDLSEAAAQGEANLDASTLAEIAFADLPATVIASGSGPLATFDSAIEEWKLLIAAGLSGVARESLRLAAAYACERKQFDQLIGAYQAISHPLADLLCDVDGGKFLVWKALRDIADGAPDAAATVSLAAWWNIDAAARAVAQSLHTFGGYGLTTEYDIHLYNLRAKGWPLVWGDPRGLLEEAGRRLYAGEAAALPDVGDVPIDFDPGEEARALVAEIDAFFEQNMTDEIRAQAHYSWEGHNPAFHKKLAQAGLLFLGWSKDMGGRGSSPYARNAAMEAFERHGWSNPVANVAGMVGAIIHRFGSEEVKREVLDRILSGDAICSLGYSEPGSGSDVFAAQCKATPDGNGWRIDGTKMFTSGANLTDYVLMLTRTNPNVPKHKGLTMFIVPLKAAGVTVQPVHTFQDERTNITFYDGVKIPDSYRLGEVDGGVKTMSAGLELEHGGGFAKVQRGMLHAAETLCREIPSAGRPLIDQPQAQMRLARTAANVMVSDLLAWRAIWAGVNKVPNLAYGPMAKMFSSEKFLSDARDLLDLTAPLSLSKREGAAALINQCYRHAQGTTIYGGTSEIHRSMIAERALGLPRTRA